MKCLKLLRINHWTKNLLIFFPLIFNRSLLEQELFLQIVNGWCLFSILSSMIYIFNDIRDVENDKLHPIKCRRPLPSGQISIREAWMIFAFLLLMLAVLLIYRRNQNDVFYLLLYFVLNVGYSIGLKNIPLVDIVILSVGFFVRIFYGGRVSGIPISDWMFLTVLSAACYFSFGKRRNELRQYGCQSRQILLRYSCDFLDKSMQLFLGLTIVFYSLSCVDKDTSVAQAGVNLAWSVPVVLVICLRYNLLLENEGCDGDPVEVVLADKWLLFLIGCYIIFILALLYGDLFKEIMWCR